MPDRIVIGWREYASLPEWGATGIKAKVDTGARTSAIDVANLQELPRERVRFDIVVRRGPPPQRITVIAPIVRRSRVRSSFGASHDRLIVRTWIKLGPIVKEVELSLVSRENMICRMLLGRQTLEPELLVDSSRWYVLGGPGRRRAARKEPGHPAAGRPGGPDGRGDRTADEAREKREARDTRERLRGSKSEERPRKRPRRRGRSKDR